MSDAVTAPRRLVALSTASVYPDRTPDAFEVAARLGYDGVEVMVTPDAVSQDVDVLRRLVDYHGLPVLAVHAPCLLVTQRVWGRDPWGKLVRAKDVAEKLGAQVVVVHPPFRWQRDYARDFASGLARMSEETDVVFAVENMFPLRARGAELAPYAPTWNPVHMDHPHVTLDLSHTAVSGSDALAMADELGGRLAHVHLADGTGLAYRDEHLVPGRGTQPCAALLRKLRADGYSGVIVLEVKTFRAPTQEARYADLAEALEFTRTNLAQAVPHSAAAAPAQPVRAQPVRAQSVRAQSAKAQSAKAQSARSARSKAARSKAALAQPAQAPAPVQLAQAQPVQAQPVEAEVASVQPVQAQPVQAQPVQAQPVQAQAASAQPVQASPGPASAPVAPPASPAPAGSASAGSASVGRARPRRAQPGRAAAAGSVADQDPLTPRGQVLAPVWKSWFTLLLTAPPA